jgi:hypothetical protein
MMSKKRGRCHCLPGTVEVHAAADRFTVTILVMTALTFIFVKICLSIVLDNNNTLKVWYNSHLAL